MHTGGTGEPPGAQPTDLMAAMGHKSAKLALEVYARKMQRDRDTAQRMKALVWAQTGTNEAPKELEPAW